MSSDSWNLAPPPGFFGLRTDRPLVRYERNLPHWRQAGATYFVTMRQADSLPQALLRQLNDLRDQWRRLSSESQQKDLSNSIYQKAIRQVEFWLDQGYGSCRLADARAARIVTDSLDHFDCQRYELGARVIMANHVHLVLRPLIPEEHTLESILQSIKTFTSRRINQLHGIRGALWQSESFDRIVRDEEHLWRCLQYIGRNPRNAGRLPNECHLWVRPEWENLGWRFTD